MIPIYLSSSSLTLSSVILHSVSEPIQCFFCFLGFFFILVFIFQFSNISFIFFIATISLLGISIFPIISRIFIFKLWDMVIVVDLKSLII